MWDAYTKVVDKTQLFCPLQIVVLMLQVAATHDQQSLKYQLLLFLLTAMELGGRENVLQVVRAGGPSVLAPMMAHCLHNVSRFSLASVGVTGQRFLDWLNPVLVTEVVGKEAIGALELCQVVASVLFWERIAVKSHFGAVLGSG